MTTKLCQRKTKLQFHGGSKDRSLLLALCADCWAHPSEKAFIMDDPKDEVFSGTTDVGLIISYLPLFDKEELKTTLSIDYKPPVLPICLAAQDFDFTDQDLHGVGWGWTYDESPKDTPIRDPYYSTCMTNEIGKEEWRFKACNMEQIQKLQWSCEKYELPPDITQELLVRCRRYFVGARRMFHGTDKSNIRFIDRVNKIFVYEGKGLRGASDTRTKLVCYNEEEFTKRGWCEVRGHSSSNGAWGFCSPSCNQQVMQVR